MLAVSGILFCLAGAGEASPIRADEEIVFFETIGHRVADGAHWELDFHGWIFETEFDSRCVFKPKLDSKDPIGVGFGPK